VVTLTEDNVRRALEDVHDPHAPVSLRAMGMLSEVRVDDDGRVELQVCIPCAACPATSAIEDHIRERLDTLEGVRAVSLTMGPHLYWDRATVDPQARSFMREFGIQI
jgi:metal-sulfur cluster biosynthetic enzyme